MNDDEILRRLGAIARSQEAEAETDFDSRWEMLAAGTLQPDALQQLRRDAGADADRLESLFSPLSAEFRREQAERWAGAMRPAAASGTGKRPRPWRWRRQALAGAALAASLALVWLWPASRDGIDLPTYHLETRGHDKQVRSDNTASRPMVEIYSPGARLVWILRPERSHSSAVAVRVLVGSGRDRRLWPMHVRTATSGSVRLTGVVGDSLPNPLGLHEIAIQIAPRGVSLGAASDDPPPGVQSIHRSVRFIQGVSR
jgi:hypothetical protein